MYSIELAFLNQGNPDNERLTEAHWLKSEYDSLIWKIGDNTINWSRFLPDKSRLSDPSNGYILSCMKRIIFDFRSSAVSRTMNDKNHCRHINNIFRLLDYTVWNSKLYRPQVSCFGEVDTNGLTEFVSLFAQDGSNGASYVKERIISEFSNILNNTTLVAKLNSYCANIPTEIYNTNTSNKVVKTFSDSDIDLIKTWLYINNFYNKGYKGKHVKHGMINRSSISRLIGAESILLSTRIDMFLRQFEYVEDYTEIERNTRFKCCEYIPCNTLSIEESSVEPYTESQIRFLGFTLSALHRLSGQIDGLPHFTVLSRINAVSIGVLHNTRKINHYRTTPVPVALNVLNRAIHFVMTYSNDLVEFAISYANAVNLLGNVQKLPQLRETIIKNIPLANSLIPLNIKSAKSYYPESNYKDGNFGRLAAPKVRNAASLEDALNLLITSVYVITASLTAQRKEAICSMTLECVIGRAGQYQAEFILPKANFNDKKAKITRPIPDLLANALSSIKRFTKEWTRIFNITHDGSMFLLPVELGPGYSLKPGRVDVLLNRFCDFIELPIDDHFRRWYIRTHESRRFFAIVFFWQFKYANLSALQWMFGHVDPCHTYAYIKESIGGAELTIEEARYTASAILGCEESSGLTKLRCLIKCHFNTDDISIIEEDDLGLYLEELINIGYYKITPHSIETSEGVRYEIIFEVTK